MEHGYIRRSMYRYNKREIGENYEEKVCDYLRGLGYEIIDKNFHTRQGEIDIVAKDNGTWVFIEVKYRSSILQGFGEESVDYHKQQKIYKSAIYYMYKKHIPADSKVRFDVIGVNEEKIHHIINAFGGI